MGQSRSVLLAEYRRLRHQFRDPLLTALTVILLLLVFVFAPFHAADIFHSQDIGVAITLVLVAGVLLLSGNPIAVLAMLVAVGLAIVAAALPDDKDARLIVLINAVAWTILGIALMWVVARTVFGPGPITYHRIIGAILLYLTIGLIFVGLYAAIGLMNPKAFVGIEVSDNPGLASELIYFSFVTLTSTGYGDILPVHPIVRSLCNVESILGQLYPATLLARLVTLELENRRQNGKGAGGGPA